MIGHFTAFVQDKQTHIGCAAINFQMQRDVYAIYLICNYAMTNVLGRSVYATGVPCSKCTSGCNDEYLGLCSTSEMIQPVPDDVWRKFGQWNRTHAEPRTQCWMAVKVKWFGQARNWTEMNGRGGGMGAMGRSWNYSSNILYIECVMRFQRSHFNDIHRTARRCKRTTESEFKNNRYRKKIHSTRFYYPFLFMFIAVVYHNFGEQSRRTLPLELALPPTRSLAPSLYLHGRSSHH